MRDPGAVAYVSAMATETSEDYERAARQLLALLIRISGWTQRRLDSHLGYSVGHVSRLLTGNTRLLYSHILDLLGAIEVEPVSFFDVLHPSTSPLHLLDLVARVRRIGEGKADDPALLPVEERVRRSVERFRVEIPGRRMRGGAHGGSKAEGASPRKRRSSPSKRSS